MRPQLALFITGSLPKVSRTGLPTRSNGHRPASRAAEGHRNSHCPVSKRLASGWQVGCGTCAGETANPGRAKEGIGERAGSSSGARHGHPGVDLSPDPPSEQRSCRLTAISAFNARPVAALDPGSESSLRSLDDATSDIAWSGACANGREIGGQPVQLPITGNAVCCSQKNAPPALGRGCGCADKLIEFSVQNRNIIRDLVNLAIDRRDIRTDRLILFSSFLEVINRVLDPYLLFGETR